MTSDLLSFLIGLIGGLLLFVMPGLLVARATYLAEYRRWMKNEQELYMKKFPKELQESGRQVLVSDDDLKRRRLQAHKSACEDATLFGIFWPIRLVYLAVSSPSKRIADWILKPIDQERAQWEQKIEETERSIEIIEDLLADGSERTQIDRDNLERSLAHDREILGRYRSYRQII